MLGRIDVDQMLAETPMRLLLEWFEYLSDPIGPKPEQDWRDMRAHLLMGGRHANHR